MVVVVVVIISFENGTSNITLKLMKSKQGPRQKTTFVTVSLASLSLPQDVYVLSAVLFPCSRHNARPAMITNGIRFPRK